MKSEQEWAGGREDNEISGQTTILEGSESQRRREKFQKGKSFTKRAENGQRGQMTQGLAEDLE